MSLKSRRKFGFVNGTIKKPTSTVDLENWEAVQRTLVQWIRHTIDPSLLANVSYVDDASVLWSELKAQFAVVDGTKIHGLKTQLHNCKQTKVMDVTSYYGKLKSLWDSLVIHEPPFACTCGKCECGIGPKAIQRLDNERLHQVFMGLDSTLYGHIRSQEFQLETLPSLNRAYNIVLQEERLCTANMDLDVLAVTAFATPSAPNSIVWRALRDKERGERQQLFCSVCNTRGHEAHMCFFKTLKFPDWWGDRPRNLADYRRYRSKGSRGGASGTTGSATAGTGAGSGSASNTVHTNAITAGASYSALLASDR
ncbi:uncharacterized protein LOC141630392 [Silene latifolia]|uniref:uncharacterized protein LOC141630392 n=1 Tax=Silene latifolia TaxID=37657 RepID=UPI003D779DD6